MNEATNFEKARGFVRTNWKTKNWNPNNDPTEVDSSTDSEDAEALYEDERRDQVATDLGRTQSPVESGSDARDNFDASMGSGGKSLNLTRNAFSETKSRKRRSQFKPQIIDVSDSQSENSTLDTV